MEKEDDEVNMKISNRSTTISAVLLCTVAGGIVAQAARAEETAGSGEPVVSVVGALDPKFSIQVSPTELRQISKGLEKLGNLPPVVTNINDLYVAGDEQAIAILKNCHHAMPEQGKLLVVEMVIPSGNEPFFGKLLDLQVLVNYQGGCERTEAEYQALFETAGFSLTKIVPTVSPLSVIEGIRISS